MVVVLVGVGCPPHCIVRCLVIHDVFVLRRTSRIDARHDVDGILHIRDLSALIALEIRAQFLAEQLIVVWIVDNLRRPRDTILCQINCCHSYLFLPKDWRHGCGMSDFSLISHSVTILHKYEKPSFIVKKFRDSRNR